MKGDNGELAFQRCHPNPYHHSLALVRADAHQLHHFALMVRDLDDVGRGTNRLPKAGVDIVFGPGRHVPSGSVFLYFLDPDGMTVEYTNGMEEFDKHTPREARRLPPTLDTIDMRAGCPSRGSPVPARSRWHRSSAASHSPATMTEAHMKVGTLGSIATFAGEATQVYASDPVRPLRQTGNAARRHGPDQGLGSIHQCTGYLDRHFRPTSTPNPLRIFTTTPARKANQAANACMPHT